MAPGSSLAKAFAIEATDLDPALRPAEIGVPWAELTGRPGVFSDASHQGHLHFAWR